MSITRDRPKDKQHVPPVDTASDPGLPDIRVPAGWTFTGLVAGIALGLVVQAPGARSLALEVLQPLGGLWLRALQMTIVPLVVALLVTGVVRTVAAAEAGTMARRTLGLFAVLLASGAAMAALVMPALLDAFPIPASAVRALQANLASEGGAALPGLGDFLSSLVPSNIVAAAADDAMLPLIVFFALFALAVTRLPPRQRAVMADLFAGLAATMMVMIGWVLRIAPVGVFALGFALAANSGTAAVAALGHYIATVSAIGAMVLLAGYGLAVLGARLPLIAFARAVGPAQAMAISTQSSLACLPAMLAACRRLGVAERHADFVLPLAVALFRATGPAMNLAVAIYVASLTGVPLTPMTLAAGVAAAALTTLGAPSLPGTISFVTSIAPIALAMGAPVGPLALLVAVEMLPDLMRTLGNVTMDVAVAATVDRHARAAATNDADDDSSSRDQSAFS
ncbi:MAG: dicarboxylate/amino acid:cation symporter [Novosphingobium sp.]